MTVHLVTLLIPRRHLRKRKSWTIRGLFDVPLEFQPRMKNLMYNHSTGFLNYTSVLANSVILLCLSTDCIGYHSVLRLPLVEQEMWTLLEFTPLLSWVRVTRSLIFCVALSRSSFVLWPSLIGHCVVFPSLNYVF